MECMLCTFCDNMSGNWHIQHSCSKALIDIQCISYIVSSVIIYTNLANQHCVVELILWKFCLMCIHVSQAAFNVYCVLSKPACFNQVWACLCWLPFMACSDYKLFPLHCYLDLSFQNKTSLYFLPIFLLNLPVHNLCDDVFYSFYIRVGFCSVLANVVPHMSVCVKLGAINNRVHGILHTTSDVYYTWNINKTKHNNFIIIKNTTLC